MRAKKTTCTIKVRKARPFNEGTVAEDLEAALQDLESWAREAKEIAKELSAHYANGGVPLLDYQDVVRIHMDLKRVGECASNMHSDSTDAMVAAKTLWLMLADPDKTKTKTKKRKKR